MEFEEWEVKIDRLLAKLDEQDGSAEMDRKTSKDE